MMVSDEEKRWLVVGIAMNKVAARVLRDYIKQGMDTHYTNLDTYCSGLTTPCTLKTLTYHHVNTSPSFKHLKFQNVNNNLHLHGKHKNLYNYNINCSVDLTKLFLPDYLAEFSAFDESLDMSAILRLLGFNNPAPIFPSPNPLISIQMSADDVRENVRNKWGHCNVKDWSEVLFNDCFSKMETLVRSLGLTGDVEKTTLDQLSDWKTKGCQLCMGHAVDQNLLSLVQQDVQELIKNVKETEVEQQVHLKEHDEELKAVLEWKEQQMTEKEKILEKLASLGKILTEELLTRIQGVEDDVSEVKDDVSEVKAHISQTDERVKQLEENVRDGKMKDDSPVNSTVESFDVTTCRSKLAEHYKRTAKVPTSVWSKTSAVDIHQIYTRLSCVKEEQTPAGSSKSKLGHYSDMFTANKSGVAPKRILVQGQTGIGKSTFVKKLAVDWAELHVEKTEAKEPTSQDDKEISSKGNEDTSSDEYEDTSSEDTSSDNESEKQKASLKKFELVLVINLKEVSKCPSLRNVVSRCNVFPDDETALVDGVLNYIAKNQEKVLLVFDGYDEYRCGRNSDIYEIFRGKKLRNCCVLITTRISKADELREFKDVHAEITGFSEVDRKAFMRRMLGGKAEAKELKQQLSRENLEDLTRIPLLLLFFCTLWKKGMLKSLPNTKTKLYLKIVQYVLDYSQGKHSSARFAQVEAFKEILSEIGKVALECLLKDDHVFEYDQLSSAILCEESRIIGLLQVTEYTDNLRPAGMVSFIHKSIQEFVAAWYITYRCVPEGNLGEIEQHARTLEDCEALENVFQFVCGLSDDGAVKVLKHLTSVRISDPTLHLSVTIPAEENETDMPLYDITDRNRRFSCLVNHSFREVCSKAELLSHFFDCNGGNVLLDENRPLSELLPKATELAQNCVFIFYFIFFDGSVMYKSLECLNCLQMPLRIPQSSKVLTVTAGNLVTEMQKRDCQRLFGFCFCSFNSILCFRNGQFQLYITRLSLQCNDHARLFTESSSDYVPSVAAGLCSGQSCLKFLRSLDVSRTSDQTLKALGGVIRNCKYLNSLQVGESGNAICDLLKQVSNPSNCSLKIGSELTVFFHVHFTFVGAAKLASLLPQFNNIVTLALDLSCCFSAVVDTLVTSISHRTLEILVLRSVSLTPVVIGALGRLLPEMTSLEKLELTGVHENLLPFEDMQTLFGGFKKTLPLRKLTFSNFDVRGRLVVLTKAFRFFPNLRVLELERLFVDESDLCILLESFGFFRSLEVIRVRETEYLDSFPCNATELNTVGALTCRRVDRELDLNKISLTPTVVAALGRLLPEISSLQQLELTGVNRKVLQAEDIKALFNGFNKTVPLNSLTFSDFSVTSCLAPLAKSLQFFPKLRQLNLEKLNMDECDLVGLVESFQFIPDLFMLNLSHNPLGHAVRSLVPHISNLQKLRILVIWKTGHSEEDLNYLRDTALQALPELKILGGTTNFP